MSLKNGFTVLRPYTRPYRVESAEDLALRKAFNHSQELKGITKAISQHKQLINRWTDDLGIELRKQEPATEEVKPPAKEEGEELSNKVVKAIVEAITALKQRLDEQEEGLEILSDEIHAVAQRQPTRARQGEYSFRHSDSDFDIEQAEAQAEKIGLCGEVKRVL